MRIRIGVLCGLVLVVSSVASAHDFWIEPGTFRPQSGEHVAISLRVGEPFDGIEVARRTSRLKRFVLVHHGEAQVTGREGALPAGIVRPSGKGLQVIALESHPSFHRMKPARFAAYLEHEGLDSVSARFDAEGTQGLVAERFKRCARSLVHVGDSGEGSDRAVGLPLVLVAEVNPYTLGIGAELPMVLLYRGQPLSDAAVVATPASAPDHPVQGRTDGQGRFTLRVESSGAWLVTAIHMIESESPDADWDSFWASLTFEIQPDL